MSLISRLKKSTKKSLNLLLAAGMYFHATTQVINSGSDVYHNYNPSPIRQEFRREFGFPVRGWPDQIEKSPKKIRKLAEIIRKEQKTRDFDLTHIKIVSDDYLKKDFLDQFSDWITTGFSGYYFSQFDTLSLAENFNDLVVHHEIKHAKAFEIIDDHPDFLDQWESISGQDEYLSNLEKFAKRFKGLNIFVEDRPDLENLLNGFINNYSRSHVHEDIAEISSIAQVYPDYLSKLSVHPKVKAKAQLAELYKLIPRGFNHYSELKLDFETCFTNAYQEIRPENFDFFLDQSNTYLSYYPDTEYHGRIHHYRGIVYFFKSVEDPSLLDTAINEFEKVISLQNQDTNLYVDTFDWLSHCHGIKGDKNSERYNQKMAEVYKKTANF